ncbi:MAG: aminotransferase class IV [Psychrilyobacter sp.]|nr:aminotransferase class IV [Psychrilyobacter sp.]
MNYIISNDKFILAEDYHIDLEDGLLYGYGVFETILVENKKAIYLEGHYNRMISSLARLDIEFEMSLTKLEMFLDMYIKKNELDKTIIRITVFKNKNSSDILITNREFSYKKSKYRDGFKMEISEFKRNTHSLLANVKSVNYLENIYALRAAKAIGSDEVVFLDTQNHISEGATSNLFFIKDGIIHTPSKECGILEGIIRSKIIDLVMTNKHLTIKQGFFSLRDLLNADEVFLTNSIMGIMPVSKIAHTTYNLSKYYITDLLIEEFNKSE